MKTIKLENWMTVTEYAVKHNISKQAIYKRVERGSLTAKRLGGVLLVFVNE